MPGCSLNRWAWFSFPAARAENGYLIKNFEEMEPIPYHPGEYQTDILSAILKVEDEESAVQFVRSWGFLGLANDAGDTEARLNMKIGAFEYAYNTKKKENPNVAPGEVMKEIKIFFNATQEENVLNTIEFAQWSRDISEVKKILNLFISDPHVAENDAEEWVNNLSDKQYEDLIGHDLEFLKQQYKQGFTQPYFYQYLLELILSGQRSLFSHRSKRGVWVQLYTGPLSNTSEGQPVLQFDGLFRFIEYMLLVEEGPSPKRCAYPKCKRLFFPSRASQKYCPPLLGNKESRCKWRHNQEIKRAKEKTS